MTMKKVGVAQRAWNRVRLAMALLWARKHGVLSLRRRPIRIRLVTMMPKCVTVGHTTPPVQTRQYYYERQLSFDSTPIFQFKMDRPSSTRFHLPHIPCINPPPHVDFEDDVVDYDDSGRKSSFIDAVHDDHQQCCYGCEDEDEEEEADIDKRAEEFIVNFYRQMKAQRQISYLQQYNETLNRD